MMDMTTIQPLATFRLMKDYRPAGDPGMHLSDLREQLAAVPDLSAAKLSSEGGSTVIATLPASNQRQKNRLKTLLTDSIRGWKVIEDSSFRLPATF